MEILLSFLYILLFLFLLSLLIMIHELGHLTAAKAFGVYCFEYSIGMGPLIFKRKRKGGETQFSLRAIPFGGYVSMYGEGVELPNGLKVDQSRSLFGIKKWKRAIVMAAGILMNLVLALIFFAVANTFPQQQLYSNQMSVAPSSIASEAGIPEGTIFKIYKEYVYQDPVSETSKSFYLIDKDTIINQDASVKYAACLNYETLNSFDQRDLSDYIFIYTLVDNEPEFSQKVDINTIDSVQIHFTSLVRDPEQNKLVEDQIYAVSILVQDGKFVSFGASLFLEEWSYDFGGVVKQTFADLGESSLLLFNAIGELVTKPSSWNNMGGIIAVGFETTAVLQNFGLGKFLFYWGFISVNLAIFNLLPFPGLDGWQLLVIGVEAVTRKKVPEKVKNIVSFVGLALLLCLMGFVVIKDLFRYVLLFML